jgi:ABC-type branched-subunit amino acid transport system ATPase component
MLEIQDLVASYGKLDILTGVSLKVERSSITAIIGPNGSGKSTLLKTIIGLVKPKSGTIQFNNEEITGLRPDQIIRKGVAFVPQIRSIFPELTVYENLVMGAYTLKDKELIKERILQVFNLFPIIQSKKKQKAKTLSGGEQRMLELSRALLLRPKLLLLDEPSAMLSINYLEEIFEKIMEINKDYDVTCVIVEQNVNKVLSVANWVYVLDKGQNKFQGDVKEFLNNEKLVNLYFSR